MKKYAAELVGTFVLVFGGCGSAVLAGEETGYSGVMQDVPLRSGFFPDGWNRANKITKSPSGDSDSEPAEAGFVPLLARLQSSAMDIALFICMRRN